jgi:hypothetical protein
MFEAVPEFSVGHPTNPDPRQHEAEAGAASRLDLDALDERLAVFDDEVFEVSGREDAGLSFGPEQPDALQEERPGELGCLFDGCADALPGPVQVGRPGTTRLKEKSRDMAARDGAEVGLPGDAAWEAQAVLAAIPAHEIGCHAHPCTTPRTLSTADDTNR